ncbi:WD repeat and FYVE domain-containing protein 1 [Turdus rufiventris]|nr:WD repeat and FYVE domain-containing protein 1 [Turdus rufiventris]
MAAEIHSRPQSRRPVLLSKVEGHQDAVSAALLIPKEDGVITAGEDRTIRVWLKRDSGQYWPSIYHTMASPCSAMAYHHDSRRIFVGQDNGAIMEFHISEDFNKMNFVKTYPGKLLTTIYTNIYVKGRYDHETQHAFVGDYSGQITLLKLEQNTCSVITTLKGHEDEYLHMQSEPIDTQFASKCKPGTVPLVFWSGLDKVQAICYIQLTRQLVSCSADGGIAVWNMDISREEAPQWLESDSCQKCEQPFFWNIKQMWDTKTIGLRQHHCRKCGQAVCGKCSTKRSSYPIMGFEFQVRVCDSCFESIKDEDRTSLATFHEGKHNISHMSMDISRGLMVTCGSDRIVKVAGESANNSGLFMSCFSIADKLLYYENVQPTYSKDWPQRFLDEFPSLSSSPSPRDMEKPDATEQIHFILLFSRQGKLRLQKWYTTLPDKEKKKIIREIVQIILSRNQKTSSFVDWKDLKLVYKRYASLYFCCAIEDQDNELLTLEVVHRYVELLDRYFGNVCELDIIFNFEKAYFILDEFIIGGEVQETSKKTAVKAIEESDMLQETVEEYMNKPAF